MKVWMEERDGRLEPDMETVNLPYLVKVGRSGKAMPSDLVKMIEALDSVCALGILDVAVPSLDWEEMDQAYRGVMRKDRPGKNYY